MGNEVSLSYFTAADIYTAVQCFQLSTFIVDSDPFVLVWP